MTFNDDITGFVNNLYRPSIFYVPESIIPNITEEMKQDLLTFGVTNTLVIIKANGEHKLYENCIPAIELLNKEKHLENNIFQLYKFKELQEDAFKYILDLYQKHVASYEYIYDWLLNNLEDNIKDATAEHKAHFQMQFTAIKSHAIKLTECFGHKKQADPKVVQESISSVFGDIKIPKSVTGISKPTKTKVKTPRKKKKVLISFEEADKYLLETVFKVNLKSKTPNN
ncbi:hypothetical protein [Algibacter mikhailovii]|uniref:Uncharacterized protein n=1 Tax=Algibacter mikhailovii TaxID=425498 RepID=A0A918QPZ5_9FLAO|nr:hypothetical protein [Algibacter mikhailovii]GGZ67248.1 hypothetical protein GCM10007028_00100 [Algibacter mikhailovii]